MPYLRKLRGIFLQAVFIISLVPIFGITVCAENLSGARENSFHDHRKNVRYLNDQWKFIFIGDDSSTVFAHSSAPDSCEEIHIPHVFPLNDQNGMPLTGYGWYFREITVPDSLPGKELFLSFEGVCLRAEVFVNGTLARGNTFAYMPFSVNVTPFLQKNKPLHIAIRVDNKLKSRRIPDDKVKGWWIYGGITREVALVVRSKRRIAHISIRTIHNAEDTFKLHCTLKPYHETPWDSVVIVIRPIEGGDPLATIAMTGTDTLLNIGGIRSWSPEDPYRYEFYVTPFFGGTPGETDTLLRGFCQLTTKGSKLYLNGKPYYLRGMARHDVLRLDGRPMTREERCSDLSDMKNLGINLLRIAHFPQHRDVYELCDSIGLLVMDEIPAWKTDPKFLATREAREYGAAYMRYLIDAHGNYTCICFWSLGNQIKSHKSSVADYVRAVSSEVKKADPSRLITFCSCFYFWDKAFSYVDVIAVNEYFGWELASLDMLPPILEKIHKEWPEKPVIITELGAQAKLGLRNPDPHLANPIKSMLGKDISEDHQALFIQSHMDTIWNKRKFVCGMVVWAYGDYMSNLNKARTPDMPQGINSCGIVTDKRKKKLAYQVIKQCFSKFRDQFNRETSKLK